MEQMYQSPKKDVNSNLKSVENKQINREQNENEINNSQSVFDKVKNKVYQTADQTSI